MRAQIRADNTALVDLADLNDFVRQAKIRAVVATQWATAIALFASPPWSPFRTTWSFVDFGYEIGGVIANLATLPTPEQIVDGAA